MAIRPGRAKLTGTNSKYIDLADKLVRERPDLAHQGEGRVWTAEDVRTTRPVNGVLAGRSLTRDVPVPLYGVCGGLGVDKDSGMARGGRAKWARQPDCTGQRSTAAVLTYPCVVAIVARENSPEDTA